MWSPTHIQVTVQKAKGLLTKGKNGTNNCFVTIGLGKEKYQTSVKDKATPDVDWHEECELTIPDRGNRAELVLTCLHRNNLGIDEFLGQVTLPLNEMDVYDRPRSKWFKLESKPGKEKKDKDRGELEVRIQFVVKSGSLTDLSKKEKHKSSIGQLASSVGGSLLSIGTIEKRKGLKKFAKSLGSKMHLSSKKKDKDLDAHSYTSSQASIGTPNSHEGHRRFGQSAGDADPGVISEDEDEFVFDNLSHKSSGSSLNIRSSVANQNKASSPVPINTSPKEDVSLRSKTLPPSKPPRIPNESPKADEWEAKLYGKHLDIISTSSDSLKRRSWESSRLPAITKEEPAEITEKNESKIEAQHLQQPQNSVESLTIPSQKGSLRSAPSSPQLTNIFEAAELNEEETLPKPMPRSQTSTSLVEKDEKEPDKHHSEKTEKKRFREKLKYFRREKVDASDELISHKNVGERIIIGHENNFLKGKDHSTEISPVIIKKYEGKSREELMMLAHNLEGDVSIQRARVKELEDYLDNLLLRVMETQPKILQNPYNRTSSTKSG